MRYKIQQRYQYLNHRIPKIKQELASLPEGKIICSKNQKRIRWQLRRGAEKRHMRRSERPLAEQLARKRYLEQELTECTKEERILKQYLQRVPEDSKSQQMLVDERYQDLLAPYYGNRTEYVRRWMEEPYEGNPYNPEERIHKSPAGYYVRSKSELMISNELYVNSIPHRYEAPLLLGTKVIYPDFTILHPVTGELYYWEHFGMMDVAEYAGGVSVKLNRYIHCKIIPSINLIVTFETERHPLDLGDVRELIRHYFS